jgi:ribulose kinase
LFIVLHGNQAGQTCLGSLFLWFYVLLSKTPCYQNKKIKALDHQYVKVIVLLMDAVPQFRIELKAAK